MLYVAYSAARLLASDDTALAIKHANDVLGVERWWHIGVETSWNSVLARHEFLSIFAGYWYASMHYLITPLVLVLLWRHSHAHYVKYRRVLVGATAIALGAYIFYPTAPPRIMDGYVDILATTSHWGWWGASASAPRGLGDLTDELAAMPSMHVGWALWCTMAIISITQALWLRIGAVLYVVVTTLVVVATANHGCSMRSSAPGSRRLCGGCSARSRSGPTTRPGPAGRPTGSTTSPATTASSARTQLVPVRS